MSTFTQRVRLLARQIPEGRVTTYGLLAAAAGGHPRMAQMITWILSKDPHPETIPYHRIVYSNGRVWLSPDCRDSRLALYQKEGIALDSQNRIVNFETLIYYFDK